MDKNQFIGMALIAAMMAGYFFFLENNKVPQDQVQTLTEQTATTPSSTPAEATSTTSSITENTTEAEIVEQVVYEHKNEDLTIQFSSHGAAVKSVVLNNFTDYLDRTLVLIDEESNELNFTAGNTSFKDIVFSAPSNVSTNNDTTLITFSSSVATITYAIPAKGFVVKQHVVLNDKSNALLKLDWKRKMRRFEKGIDESINRSTINYYTTGGDFNDIGTGTEESESVESSLKWFSLKQRFFNTGFIASSSIQNAVFTSNKIEGDTSFLRSTTASASVLLDNGTTSFRYYFGPNDYKITKNVTAGYGDNVYMGWAVFSIINKWVVVPIFKFLEKFIDNYGIIILLLVIIIKMVLFPIAYRSYLSMAKMKELQPEIAAIKEQYGDDAQKVQSEQMKLYGQVGVNPIAGCIPMVLQMPILLALFNFFPNSIELRHKAFLWAPDLSTYDAPIAWGFDIWPLGDHISMFTLLMTLSTLAYTYYNSQMTSTAQQGPMKYMGYAMPVIFFFALNNFSAGLTYYYFVSNLITISQQLIATRFIDKDKIRLTMEENRKNAKTGNGKQSKFQARLQEAMKAQQVAKKKG